MARSVEQNVERNTFVLARRRNRLSITSDDRLVPGVDVFRRYLLACERRPGWRIEWSLASTRRQADRRDEGADHGKTEKGAVRMPHGEHSLLENDSKTEKQGEVRISLFRAYAAIFWPARAHFWVRYHRSSSGFLPSDRPRER